MKVAEGVLHGLRCEQGGTAEHTNQTKGCSVVLLSPPQIQLDQHQKRSATLAGG